MISEDVLITGGAGLITTIVSGFHGFLQEENIILK